MIIKMTLQGHNFPLYFEATDREQLSQRIAYHLMMMPGEKITLEAENDDSISFLRVNLCEKVELPELKFD